MSNSNPQDVFRFKALRAPKSLDTQKWFRRYIKDNYMLLRRDPIEFKLQDRDLPTQTGIGHEVFNEVFCAESSSERIIDIALNMPDFVNKVETGCDENGRLKGYPSKYPTYYRQNGNNVIGYSFLYRDKLPAMLDVAADIIEAHLKTSCLDKAKLICQLQTAIHDGWPPYLEAPVPDTFFEFVAISASSASLPTIVGNSDVFLRIKGDLFECLYHGLIARRKFPELNLDPIYRQLRALHVIEYLTYDTFYHELRLAIRRRGCNLILYWLHRIYSRLVKPSNSAMQNSEYTLLRRSNPSISDLRAALGMENACNISIFTEIGRVLLQEHFGTLQDLADYYGATPMVHPIFIRLSRLLIPFNSIRPVGIADLKLVKQILIQYEAGDIAYIENVLKGESKERVHRQLDTIETFISDETENTSETTQENQTASRSEMQRETQRVLNEELNLNTDITVSYDGPTVDVAANAGFSFNKSSEESERNATNYAKEVMNRSVEHITRRVRALRTTRRMSETEETNRHGFDNRNGNGHITGIYRYVNKRYKAQVFSYGKRLMFEFLVPEPADFYVLSKIKGYELFELECIKKSDSSVADLLDMPVANAQDITKDKYNELKTTYDLSAFGEYPEKKSKIVPLTTEASATSGASLAEGSVSKEIGVWGNLYTKRVTFKLAEKGYKIKKIIIDGKIVFHFYDNDHDAVKDFNKFELLVNNSPVPMPFQQFSNPLTPNPLGAKLLGTPEEQRRVREEIALPANLEVGADGSVQVDVLLQDAKYFNLNFSLEIEPKNDLVTEFQNNVYNKIKSLLDTANATKKANVATANATVEAAYQKKVEEIKKIKIKDIIQGKSEQFNREFIQKELRRQSLSMITKAFDSDTADNPPISDFATAESKPIDASSWSIDINDKATVDECVVSFQPQSKIVDYSTFNFESSQRKGRYVQFLENAFEWQKISYVLYPYFWANESKWIDMLHRDDRADPNMTAFLQAGYARVLVPVRPAFEAAVLHFLYTREPWNGQEAPAINDDLYLPLYEEIREQTDEYYGAKPEGKHWEYVLPTSLVYLQGSYELPKFDAEFPTQTPV